MSITKAIKSLLFALPAIAFCACEDNVSEIGGSLVNGEVLIVADTIEYKLTTNTNKIEELDARSESKLLGRINIPEYGSLDCSFVSQLMSATKMNIPDSITANEVDSMRMILTVPRGSLTGDSLTPQQLTVYPLTKVLPTNISNSFDPVADGYVDKNKKLGVKSYTLSSLSLNDSLFQLGGSIRIPIDLGRDMAVKYFNMYRDSITAPIFQWPATFAKEFPGVYVEQNFGNGCVGLISSLSVYTYWHRTDLDYVKKQKEEGKEDEADEYEYIPVIRRDSVCLFASQPEVISSNLIKYEVADYLKNMVAEGKSIITTPGGYTLNFKFPAMDIINLYNKDLARLSAVSTLSFEIPATEINNDYDLGVAPYLLMVRSDKEEEFFAKNQIPDGLTSFSCEYNPDKESYTFTGLRQYILDLIDKYRNGETIEDKELDFTLVPVIIDTETVQNYYGSPTVYVTRCAPYIGRPTMTELNTDKAKIYFYFSRQEIE